MPLHSNLLRMDLTPKEKALELAAKSMGVVKETDKEGKELPYYMVPITIRKRDMTITTVEAIIMAKELPKENKIWWKEVLAELKKLPVE